MDTFKKIKSNRRPVVLRLSVLVLHSTIQTSQICWNEFAHSTFILLGSPLPLQLVTSELHRSIHVPDIKWKIKWPCATKLLDPALLQNYVVKTTQLHQLNVNKSYAIVSRTTPIKILPWHVSNMKRTLKVESFSLRSYVSRPERSFQIFLSVDEILRFSFKEMGQTSQQISRMFRSKMHYSRRNGHFLERKQKLNVRCTTQKMSSTHYIIRIDTKQMTYNTIKHGNVKFLLGRKDYKEKILHRQLNTVHETE